MCFSNEHDWYADVTDESFCRNAGDARCFECGEFIADGDWRYKCHQQEHEDCLICGVYNDNYDDTVMRDFCEHDYGETFDAEICRECLLTLAAIYDLEEIEGCPEDSRQPMFGELLQVLTNEWVYGDEFKYRRHALEKYPELVASRVMQMTCPPPRRSNLIHWCTT